MLGGESGNEEKKRQKRLVGNESQGFNFAQTTGMSHWVA